MGLMIMNGVEYSGGADKVAMGGRIDTLDNTMRTAINTSYELVASIQNYDVILVMLGYNGNDTPYCGSFDIPVKAIEYNRDFWVAGGNVDRAIRVCFTDATHYTMEYVRETNKDCILGVYGIKYGFIGDVGLHKYSADEKVVGTWINGKPIYEKTLHIDSIPSASFTATHGISNLKEVVAINGMIRCFRDFYFYETLNDHAGMSSAYYTRVGDITTSDLTITLGSNRAAITTDIYITLQYTKTTD